MSIFFEELDYRPTPMGVLTLRRRRKPGSDVDVYEIKLGDEFLMSSAFTAAEIALADIGLSSLPQDGLDVVVGGLGLGYTAQAALANKRVGALVVIDALPEVIEWHQAGLIPVGRELTADPRCRLVHGDFFTMATSASGSLDPAAPGRRFDAVLVDIDHAPDNLLHPSHAVLYTAAGLQRLSEHLKPGGVFALWSNDPPDAAFEALLERVFGAVQAHVV
ncbi:MAG: spermidine synthase, partial [Tardiphaga sp.]